MSQSLFLSFKHSEEKNQGLFRYFVTSMDAIVDVQV